MITVEQAREALDNMDDCARMDCGVNAFGPMKVLTEFINQAEQTQPVAWRYKQFFENQQGWLYANWHPEGITPPTAELLYTAPPQRQPLTDEEIDQLLPEIVSGGTFTVITYGRAVARAIEAAHGIKE